MIRNHEPVVSHINELILRFNQYLSSKFKINEIKFDLSEEEDNFLNFVNRRHFHYEYPKYANYKGVYFFFGFNKEELPKTCLYIGKSSMNNAISSRLNDYLGSTDITRFEEIDYHTKGNQFIELLTYIPFDNEHSFLAPALEEFLIRNWELESCNLVNTIGNS